MRLDFLCSFLPPFFFLTSGLELRELGGLSDVSLSLGLFLDFTLRFLDFFFFLLLLLTELSLPKDNIQISFHETLRKCLQPSIFYNLPREWYQT